MDTVEAPSAAGNLGHRWAGAVPQPGTDLLPECRLVPLPRCCLPEVLLLAILPVAVLLQQLFPCRRLEVHGRGLQGRGNSSKGLFAHADAAVLVFDVTDPDSFRWATRSDLGFGHVDLVPCCPQAGVHPRPPCTLRHILMLSRVCFCRRVRDWVKELRQMVRSQVAELHV